MLRNNGFTTDALLDLAWRQTWQVAAVAALVAIVVVIILALAVRRLRTTAATEVDEVRESILAAHEVAHTRLQWWRGEIDRLRNEQLAELLQRDGNCVSFRAMDQGRVIADGPTVLAGDGRALAERMTDYAQALKFEDLPAEVVHEESREALACYLSCRSFFTDATPGTERASATALLISAGLSSAPLRRTTLPFVSTEMSVTLSVGSLRIALLTLVVMTLSSR